MVETSFDRKALAEVYYVLIMLETEKLEDEWIEQE